METKTVLSTAPQKKRDYILDVAKGIGILLVVFAHCNKTHPFETIVYSFHMPLFFIISGMFFNKQRYPTFKAFLKKRIKTLIVPYCIFVVLSLAAFLLWNILIGSPILPTLHTLLNYLIGFVYDRYSHDFANINTPMWFVLCLFLTEILYYFVSKINNPFLFYCIIVLLVGFGWYSESKYATIDFSLLPWNFSSACFSVGFYGIGNKLFPLYQKLVAFLNGVKKDKLLAFILAVVCFSITVWLALINGKISIGSRILNNGFLLYLTGIIGTLGTILISYILQKSRFLKYCGKNSFVIMALHWPILTTLLTKRVLPLFTDKVVATNWGPACVAFVLDFAACLICVMLYHKVKQLILKEKSHG